MHIYIFIFKFEYFLNRISLNRTRATRAFEMSTQAVLGLLRIPRSTPVPWIKDNAILALPDNVLTYVVLYTFS
jgi:hypothetical protein